MRLLIRRKKRLNKLPYLKSERKSFNRHSKKKSLLPQSFPNQIRLKSFLD